MSNLFDKISTLVNAQVNDLLGRNPQSPLARIRLKRRGCREGSAAFGGEFAPPPRGSGRI